MPSDADSSERMQQEVGAYSSRTRLGMIWLPLHLGLLFAPFFIGAMASGKVGFPYDMIVLFGGLGLSWLLSGPLFERSLEWAAFIAMLLFPKRGGDDE